MPKIHGKLHLFNDRDNNLLFEVEDFLKGLLISGTGISHCFLFSNVISLSL